jgi:molybdopterin converting factor subunit 1
MYFAQLKEMLGPTENIQLQDSSTVAALVEVVRLMHGSIGGVGRILVAVNGEFAKPGDVLAEGDVVALFPPVSGG